MLINKNIFNKIIKSDFFQNILKMFSATAIAQFLQVLGSLLLARLYVPEQFGLFSIFMSIIMFLVLLSTLRYESALIIEKHNNTTRALLNSLFTYILVFNTFVLIVLIFLPKSLLEHYKIYGFYYLIPIGIIAYSYYNTLISYLIRNKKFGLIAKIKVVITFLIIFFQIVFYFLNIKYGLILGFTLAYLLVDIYLFIIQKGKLKIYSKYRINPVLKKYFYLIKFGLPMQLVDTLTNAILPFLIAFWFDLKTAGIYFFAYKIINLPLQLIGVSIGKVFYQKASFLFNNDKKQMHRLVINTTLLVATLVIIPLIILYLYSSDIILIAVGEKWIKASKYISIIVFMLFFRSISSALSPIADILQRLHVLFITSIGFLLIYVIAMYIGKLQNNFVLALKIISFFSSLLYLFIILYFIQITKPNKL